MKKLMICLVVLFAAGCSFQETKSMALKEPVKTLGLKINAPNEETVKLFVNVMSANFEKAGYAIDSNSTLQVEGTVVFAGGLAKGWIENAFFTIKSNGQILKDFTYERQWDLSLMGKTPLELAKIFSGKIIKTLKSQN